MNQIDPASKTHTTLPNWKKTAFSNSEHLQLKQMSQRSKLQATLLAWNASNSKRTSNILTDHTSSSNLHHEYTQIQSLWKCAEPYDAFGVEREPGSAERSASGSGEIPVLRVYANDSEHLLPVAGREVAVRGGR
jgi:hypothetical protein